MKSNPATPEMHSKLLDAKYDASWKRYHDGLADLVDRYNVTIALCKGPSVLDIGCGECLLGQLLLRKEEVANIVGIDACKAMVDMARVRLGKQVELHVCNAEKMPFLDGEFDTVVLGQVLEHVLNVGEVAEESMRVLKQGGRLIVSVPCNEQEPHFNHLHVFESLEELLDLFPGIVWEGKGTLHRFYYAWGYKQ
jgi:ubiquinone/menaquinone biosynthesis C-methylase UbiE